MMFWVLALYHVPLCMYSTDEELRAISIAGVQLFHKSQQLDVYLAQLANVCITVRVRSLLLHLCAWRRHHAPCWLCLCCRAHV